MARDRHRKLRIACLWGQAALMLSLLQCIHDAIHPLYAPFVEP